MGIIKKDDAIKKTESPVPHTAPSPTHAPSHAPVPSPAASPSQEHLHGTASVPKSHVPTLPPAEGRHPRSTPPKK